MVSRKVFQSGFGPLLGLFFGYPQLWEMKKEREKVEKERERDRERKREREGERDREREREISRERGRWKMETNRRRERERETERGRGRGERERCKWWAAGCFRVVSDLFLSVGYLSFGEKTGKNGKRKKRREKETERKKKSWDGEQEDVSNWFQTSFGAGYGAT